jgi:hypothetical protein
MQIRLKTGEADAFNSFIQLDILQGELDVEYGSLVPQSASFRLAPHWDRARGIFPAEGTHRQGHDYLFSNVCEVISRREKNQAHFGVQFNFPAAGSSVTAIPAKASAASQRILEFCKTATARESTRLSTVPSTSIISPTRTSRSRSQGDKNTPSASAASVTVG